MKRNWLLPGLAIILLSACNNEHHEATEQSVYTVSLPEKKDTTVYQEFIGQIRSIQHIELRALEKGYLQNIFVDEGQLVKKGQLLFQIMPLIYEAELEKAKAEADFAEIEYKTTKALADSNIVSPNELALAKAEYDKVKAELRLAETHLSFTEIRAPFDGIIGRFNEVRLGSLVEEGELLTTLSDNSDMWVYFNVPEAAYLEFVSDEAEKDKREHVKLRMANGDFFESEGIVETIEADFNNETGNIAFRATFPNTKGVLRHGQTGAVLMPESLKGALLIPQKATFEILDKKFVYLVKDGTIRSQQIEVGVEMPHIYEVKSGITLQDTLLIDGLRKVKNGDHVETRYTPQAQIFGELDHLHAE
ncbi:MAG: efflux RND transporter periplasmic adaptor subunit [Flavobacteriales bacterium]|nr:efflux RND transporter periplasmic adaptor subunit [Flavobacteriales bacterium]